MQKRERATVLVARFDCGGVLWGLDWFAATPSEVANEMTPKGGDDQKRLDALWAELPEHVKAGLLATVKAGETATA